MKVSDSLRFTNDNQSCYHMVFLFCIQSDLEILSELQIGK